jgi:hypothetical protein
MIEDVTIGEAIEDEVEEVKVTERDKLAWDGRVVARWYSSSCRSLARYSIAAPLNSRAPPSPLL